MGFSLRRLTCWLLVLLVLSFSRLATAEGPDISPISILEEQIRTIPTHDLEAFLRQLSPDVREQLPPFDLRRMVFDPDEGLRFDFREVVSLLSEQLVREVVVGSRLLLQLIILAMISALLRSISLSVGSKDVTDIAFMVSLLALILVGAQAFRAVLDVADSAITEMVTFMHALLPLMVTLLAAVGGVTSAAIFHPILVTVVIAVGTVVKGMLFPLAFSGVVLTVLGKVVEDAPIGRLAGLIRQWSTTILGLLFIVFMGVLSVRGAIGPVVDGLGIKTAKFLTGTFVPVIGGRLADALEVVVGGSLLLKNAVGAFGMIVVFLLTALPALKIFSLLIIFRLATVFVEPISEDRLVSAMASIGDGVALVLACVLTTALMFFISVTALVTLGNVTAMLR